MSNFQPASLYPELEPLYKYRDIFMVEAALARSHLHYIEDERAEPDTWGVLALRIEEEDLDVVSGAACAANRELMPLTCGILDKVPNLQAYAVSSLVPGGRILEHTHENNLVTAVMCLQGGGESYIVVNGERKDYRNGEFVIFDYRHRHAIFNDGLVDRVAMLLLFENRGGGLFDKTPSTS
jgi:quercetin dioxygenase-like cupin family protein